MRRASLGLSVLTSVVVALSWIPGATAEQGQLTIGADTDVVVLTLSLNRGDAVDYSWSANASVDFRVEDVPGSVMFLERQGQVGSGTFEAPADGVYTFGFRNRNTFSVTVDWTLTRRLAAPLLIGAAVASVLAVAGILALLLVRRRRRAPPPPDDEPPIP